MICVLAAGALLALAADHFTLDWTHSVERTRWHETWQAGPGGLRPVEAMIEGPGAGMELPEGAWREADGWHYRPAVAPQPEVLLASSGATGAGWRLCAAGSCHDLGALADQPIRLWSAPVCNRPSD